MAKVNSMNFLTLFLGLPCETQTSSNLVAWYRIIMKVTRVHAVYKNKSFISRYIKTLITFLYSIMRGLRVSPETSPRNTEMCYLYETWQHDSFRDRMNNQSLIYILKYFALIGWLVKRQKCTNDFFGVSQKCIFCLNLQ